MDEYVIFLAKTLTVVVAVVIVLILAGTLRQARVRSQRGHLNISCLNDRYRDMQEQLEQAVLDKSAHKAIKKQRIKARKAEDKRGGRPRVFVLSFAGDLKASAVDNLREEVTALLGMACEHDEVVVQLESPGGMVHGYGLAASQLARIRQAKISLTICVDKVAASGGYMMACLGNRILAAPFAVLGSIGVVAQLPNLHRFLQKHDVDFEVLTAGEFKRTLTMFGENTPQGREKFQQDLETTHQLFKGFVAEYRPALDIEKVATGEIWLGLAALEQKLVDDLMTSDEYLVRRAQEADLYLLEYQEKKGLAERMGGILSKSLEAVILRLWSRIVSQRFW